MIINSKKVQLSCRKRSFGNKLNATAVIHWQHVSNQNYQRSDLKEISASGKWQKDNHVSNQDPDQNR